ncbi:MAG: uncharacterized protein PWQ20_90 [Thermotogaceae bacterium]|nr:uncharacterized protein [Thermotogaceae bacterium]MDN5337020.1 uncharacterized protein [Thermotogaceae bacterium]
MRKKNKSKKNLIIAVSILSTIFVGFVLFFSIDRSNTLSLEFPKGRLKIVQNSKSMEIEIEIADKEELWQQGLMFRKSIPWKYGMLFVFPENATSGFWMKNTLIPLDIAFINSNGEIINIQRMEPCKAEVCRIYKSPIPYRFALEVKAGFFEKFGFSEGAKIEFSIEQ